MKTGKEENKQILVIDDDEILLFAMKKKLETSGFRVTTSNSIQDAYFKLNMLKPDMIILDIVMPDINGIEFMNLINSQLMITNTPIILMSSLSKKELYNMGYKFGASRYLSKPFDINELPALINETFTEIKSGG